MSRAFKAVGLAVGLHLVVCHSSPAFLGSVGVGGGSRRSLAGLRTQLLANSFRATKSCQNLGKLELKMGGVALPTTYFRETWIGTSSPPGQGKKLRGVIWDIDGTLADSKKLAFDATNQVLRANGYAEVNEAQYAEGSRYPTPLRFSHHSGLPEDSADFLPVGERLGGEFDELYIGLVSTETAGFYPGLKELLGRLKTNYKLGVLTNAAVKYAEAVVSANGVEGWMETVHGADDVPAAKPKPDGLLLCCKELGFDPRDVVYIGDSPTDGAAARSAGCCSIAVTWGANTASALGNNADVVCTSVEQLEEALTGVRNSPEVHMLLDRDGVINFDVGYPGAVDVQQMELLPKVIEALRQLKKQGHRVSLVTNQSAIVKGLSSRGNLMQIHQVMMDLIGEGLIDDCHVSTGEMSEGSFINFGLKPKADVVRHAITIAASEGAHKIMVGDKISDLVAGLRAGATELHLVTSSHHGKDSLRILSNKDAVNQISEEAQLKGITREEFLEVVKRTSIHDDLFALVESMEAKAK